ncbi:hypothetical protein G6F57_019734 [Rhizopus arrhizus]|nr:hypothetical protein G6F57_019734 [Rhizopus arrhizus]
MESERLVSNTGTRVPSTRPAVPAPASQDVGVAGHARHDALLVRRVARDRVIERQRPIDIAAPDLLAVGHLRQRGGVQRGRHRRVDGLGRAQHRKLRARHTQRPRQVDGVLGDVRLFLQGRCDVDGRVRQDEQLGIRGHRHDECVADAAVRAQPGFAGHHGRHEMVRVQAALHQQGGLAVAHQRHGGSA